MDPVLKKGAIFNPGDLERSRVFGLDEDEFGNALPPPRYFWCAHCARTYARGEYRVVGDLQMCPYAECGGDALIDAWNWDLVRRDTDYPMHPVEGVVYPLPPRRPAPPFPRLLHRPDVSWEEWGALLSTAFRPCEAQAHRIADDAFEVDIRNAGEPVLAVTVGGHRRISDQYARSLIADVRERLRARGIKLAPWRFPHRG